MRTRWATERAPIFSMTRERCSSTVRWLSPICCAMILFGAAAGDEIQHLALARGERDDPFANQVQLRQGMAVFPVVIERFADAFDEIGVLEGLLQIIEGAPPHRFNGARHIAVSGGEDHWNDGAAAIELFLQLQARHSRHEYVKDQATGLQGVVLSRNSCAEPKA